MPKRDTTRSCTICGLSVEQRDHVTWWHPDWIIELGPVKDGRQTWSSTKSDCPRAGRELNASEVREFAPP